MPLQNTDREHAATIINTLILKNKDAIDQYQQAIAITKDPETKSVLRQLQNYRVTLYDELMPLHTPSPVANKGREALNSYLYNHRQAFQQALEKNDRLTFLRLIAEGEQALTAYYTQSLRVKNLPDGIRTILEAQHKRVLKVAQNMERMRKIPLRRAQQIV
jgi:uncharacterized protein (TIGR02284 family)